ncbi:hypothetical protein V8C86DRAFT_974786 [Haematococcus lacustris]
MLTDANRQVSVRACKFVSEQWHSVPQTIIKVGRAKNQRAGADLTPLSSLCPSLFTDQPRPPLPCFSMQTTTPVSPATSNPPPAVAQCPSLPAAGNTQVVAQRHFVSTATPRSGRNPPVSTLSGPGGQPRSWLGPAPWPQCGAAGGAASPPPSLHQARQGWCWDASSCCLHEERPKPEALAIPPSHGAPRPALLLLSLVPQPLELPGQRGQEEQGGVLPPLLPSQQR